MQSLFRKGAAHRRCGFVERLGVAGATRDKIARESAAGAGPVKRGVERLFNEKPKSLSGKGKSYSFARGSFSFGRGSFSLARKSCRVRYEKWGLVAVRPFLPIGQQREKRIKKGRSAQDPGSLQRLPMPPRGGNPALDDTGLGDIVAFLRQLQKEAVENEFSSDLHTSSTQPFDAPAAGGQSAAAGE